MFGMNKRKNKKQDWLFELESTVSDTQKEKALLVSVDDTIASLKSQLRKGSNQEEFDAMQTLLHGYLAVKKVVGRINRYRK